MSNNLSWRDALKQFNDKRIQEGGKYTIPKKGTPEYASVRELMGEKSDAVPLQPNQTVTGQTAPGKSTGKPREPTKSRTSKRTDSEEKIHKAVQTLVSTKVDIPKQKKAKKENDKLVLAKEEVDNEQNIKKTKTKNTKKKSVGTQTEAPFSPKPEDFTVHLE